MFSKATVYSCCLDILAINVEIEITYRDRVNSGHINQYAVLYAGLYQLIYPSNAWLDKMIQKR